MWPSYRSKLVTRPPYCPLFGQYWSCDLNTVVITSCPLIGRLERSLDTEILDTMESKNSTFREKDDHFLLTTYSFGTFHPWFFRWQAGRRVKVTTPSLAKSGHHFQTKTMLLTCVLISKYGMSSVHPSLSYAQADWGSVKNVEASVSHRFKFRGNLKLDILTNVFKALSWMSQFLVWLARASYSRRFPNFKLKSRHPKEKLTLGKILGLFFKVWHYCWQPKQCLTTRDILMFLFTIFFFSDRNWWTGSRSPPARQPGDTGGWLRAWPCPPVSRPCLRWRWAIKYDGECTRW